ncbi:RING-H2 finger protein ATL17 [Sesamum alatum]|uniref:RING-H2 finger protein ATL17 n=1 Tax=Sesamum alatum TaxID=300844 RepID=A0AAE2CG09_9LAMI|nr:RING-H2 finger protein ATL17 [Sesamum alatum]
MGNRAISVDACSSTCVVALHLSPNFNAPLFLSSPSPINAPPATPYFQAPSSGFFSLDFSQSPSELSANKPTVPVKMLICCPLIKRWFYTTVHCVCRELIASQSGLAVRVLKKFAAALFTCIFALGGASIGAVTGAIKGQTTETGFVRGFGVGAVAGAVTGVQLMELIANGEPFSKVALICSLLNGKIFMEWVSPAVLKAYQWQVSTTETSLMEMSDIFEVTTVRGLSQDTIKELPVYQFCNAQTTSSFSEASCAICLQDLNDGESARMLPSCKHFFHLDCIDQWLTRQGNCPICRKDV